LDTCFILKNKIGEGEGAAMGRPKRLGGRRNEPGLAHFGGVANLKKKSRGSVSKRGMSLNPRGEIEDWRYKKSGGGGSPSKFPGV